MNVLKGRIGADAQTFDLDAGGSLQFESVLDARPGKPVILGIRPKYVTLSDIGSPATVKPIEPTGADLHVNLDIFGSELTAVFHQRLSLKEGQDVNLAIPAGRVHIFDPETETRMSG